MRYPPLQEVIATKSNMGTPAWKRPDIPAISDPNQPPVAPVRPTSDDPQGLSGLVPLEVGDETMRTPPTQLSVAEDRYKDAVASRPHKQSALAQGAWWALQGINKIFNPQDDTPVQWLGEAKRGDRIMKAGQRLAPLRAEEAYQQQQIGAQQKVKMDNLEYQLKISKGMQEAFNNDPDVKMIFETKRVTSEQAARLNQKYGTSYERNYWGDFVEKEVGGRSYVRPKFSPNYAENTSLPTDMPETTVSTPLSGGGTGYITSKGAVTADSQERVAGITANRAIATTNANIADGVQQRNTKAINDYNNNVVQFGNTVAQKMAELGDTVGAGEIAQLSQQIEAANLAYTQSADEDEAATRLKAVNDLSAQLTTLYDKQSKNAAVQQALQGMKPPVKPKFEKPVQVDMSSSGKPFAQPQGGGTNKTTLESATQYYTSKGLTGSALKAAIANARKMGMIE